MLIFYGQPLNVRAFTKKMTMQGDDGREGPKTSAIRTEPFERLGSPDPASPIVISVPHAGRHYPEALLARARVSADVLQRLEDRHVDALLPDLVGRGCTALVACTARAAIDLNRDPRDIDRQIVAGIPADFGLIQSAKQRGGLGLFPRSLPRVGELWSRAQPWSEARLLLERCHAAYHDAITGALKHLRGRYDQVLLLDLHSMPPLPSGQGAAPRPDIVIGDRFGGSVPARYSELARTVATDHGFVVALNHPYPGYYIIERHGRPATGRYAMQIEISRDLYLDDRLDLPGPGLPRVQAMLAELVEVTSEEMSRGGFSVAAE